MIDDTLYAAWLNDPGAQRVALYEIGVNSGGSEITRYLSNATYLGAAAATPYIPAIAGGIKAPEKISLSAEASLSAGDIEIHNVDGSFDTWLDDIWVNRSAKVYVGDVRWPRSDFRLLFNGWIANCVSKNRDRINLVLRDRLQALNAPIQEAKVGGTGSSKDALIPLCFGECHNVTPVLVNPVTLEYQVHDGPVESIFEVRDNGVPVTATIDNATGKFRLASSPVGTVTCSVQGDKFGGVYSNTISKLVQRIVMGFGKASQRFTAGDLDAANLAAFETAHPQPVGLYIPARMNVIEACRQLASSVGAQMIPSRTGLLRLIQISFPATATLDLPRSEQLDRSITIAERTDVVAAVKVGFCKNWTVQAGLQTAIPAEHLSLYATEWLSATASSTTVRDAYNLFVDPVQRDTCLLVEADAQAEAARDLAIRSVVRTTYRMDGPPSMLLLELGTACNLYSNRFGLAAGKVGVITGLVPDPSDLHVTVEVTV